MINALAPDGRTTTPFEEFEAALAWWREAGVDHDYLDVPADWLAGPEAKPAVTAVREAPALPPEPPKLTAAQRARAPSASRPRIGGDPADWPQSLEKFREYWLTEPSLADGEVAQRLPPRGVAGSKLMVLAPHPQRDDGEALLSGAAGRMVEALLRAMAVAPHEAYLASALPAPSALPDWDDLAARGLGGVILHHIALARPARVLAMGRMLAPLFAIAPDAAREPSHLVMPDGTRVPLLLAPDFAELARSPARRRNFWQRWLEWTA